MGGGEGREGRGERDGEKLKKEEEEGEIKGTKE